MGAALLFETRRWRRATRAMRTWLRSSGIASPRSNKRRGNGSAGSDSTSFMEQRRPREQSIRLLEWPEPRIDASLRHLPTGANGRPSQPRDADRRERTDERNLPLPRCGAVVSSFIRRRREAGLPGRRRLLPPIGVGGRLCRFGVQQRHRRVHSGCFEQSDASFPHSNPA